MNNASQTPASDTPAEQLASEAGAKRRAPKPLSRLRKWLFRSIAISLSLLTIVIFELALRLLDVGHETRLVIRASDTARTTVFQFNTAADRAYYGVEDLSGPDARPFEIPKATGTFRIVVVGGSTVAGFPYSFEFAVPKQLELVLHEQMPEREFEVLNAGITAISSFCEVDIVSQVVACQPDLIVVHSGHNEFYGPGGSASNSSSLPPNLYTLMQALRRQRSFQLLASVIYKPRGKHLLETLPADIAIPLDGQVFRETRQRYQANLTRIVDIAVQAKIPIVLSTVPSNLRDIAPLQPPNDRTANDLKEVENRMSYHEYGLALDGLTKARQLDPMNPLLAYREGQCLETLNRRAEAAESYSLASDLDGCRLRAARSFLTAVRDVAASATDNVYFCDVAAELRSRSELPVPGNDFFLEHVHYNLQGNWQVASILGEYIVKNVIGSSWLPERLPDNHRRDQLLGVTSLDHLAADSLTLVVFEAWPFTLSPARDRETNILKARIAANYRALEPTQRELFANLSMNALPQHLWHAMGNALLAAGQTDQALSAFQRHIDRQPWSIAGYVGAARALHAQGKLDEAKGILNRARKVAVGISQLEKFKTDSK